MEDYKHLLPRNCPLHHMICTILQFTIKHSINFIDTHTHTSTKSFTPLWRNQCLLIQVVLHLIYFCKRFIDKIFLSSLVLTPSSNFWWHLWIQSALPLNTHSPTPKNLFLSKISKSSYLNQENLRKQSHWLHDTTSLSLPPPTQLWKRYHLFTANSIQHDHLRRSHLTGIT